MNEHNDGEQTSMDEHNEPVQAVIAVIAGVMATASAALGYAAEASAPRLHEVQKEINGRCTYPKSHVLGLGIAALATLTVYRFYCPRIREQTLKARLSFISSWVAWLAGMTFYVVGLVMVNGQEMDIYYDDKTGTHVVCHVVKPGIYAAGASFASATIVLEIVHLFISSS